MQKRQLDQTDKLEILDDDDDEKDMEKKGVKKDKVV